MADTDSSVRSGARPDPLLLRFIDRLSGGAAVVAGVALVALMLNVAADVVVRTITDRPIGRTLELTTFWYMPVLVTMAYAVTEREREHITVTLLLDRLSAGLRRYVEAAFTALGTILVSVLAWYTTVDAIGAAEVRLAANSTPPLEYWPAKLLAALGLSLLALQLAASTYRHLAGLSASSQVPAAEGDVL